MTKKPVNTKKIVLIALFTAIVIILQLLGTFVRFGPFSVSLVLMPIVIGAALHGIMAGAWLGFAFALAVLISGDAALFLAINPAGAIITVLLKGMLAGLAAGAIYKALAKAGKTLAALAAAVICPMVNTGVFIICSYVFFLSTLAEWSVDAGFTNVTAFIFVGMVGMNFFFELGLNLIMSPAIIRLIQYGQRPI